MSGHLGCCQSLQSQIMLQGLPCSCLFILMEAYLQGRLLEVGLPGQNDSVYVALPESRDVVPV